MNNLYFQAIILTTKIKIAEEYSIVLNIAVKWKTITLRSLFF